MLQQICASLANTVDQLQHANVSRLTSAKGLFVNRTLI